MSRFPDTAPAQEGDAMSTDQTGHAPAPIPQNEFDIITAIAYLLSHGYGFSMEKVAAAMRRPVGEDELEELFARAFSHTGRPNRDWFTAFVAATNESGEPYTFVGTSSRSGRFEWIGMLFRDPGLPVIRQDSSGEQILTDPAYIVRVTHEFPFVALRNPNLDSRPGPNT